MILRFDTKPNRRSDNPLMRFRAAVNDWMWDQTEGIAKGFKPRTFYQCWKGTGR